MNKYESNKCENMKDNDYIHYIVQSLVESRYLNRYKYISINYH